MASEVSIANSALRKVGEKTIQSFTEGTEEANAINDIYAIHRDDLLRQHPWNFAVRWTKLAQLTDEPEAGFDHFYSLPADWLRTIRVSDNDAGLGLVDYREEADDDNLRIASSADEVWLRYIVQVTDPNRMTADFREVLAYRMAMDLALILANSNTLHKLMLDYFKTVFRRAKSIDAMSDQSPALPAGTWVTSRRAWRRPGQAIVQGNTGND